MSPSKRSHKSIVPYAVVLGAVIAMFFLRLALNPVLKEKQPYSLFYFMTIFVAWRYGWRPAVFGTVLSAVLAFWAFVPPQFEFGPMQLGDKLTLFSFSVLALTLIFLMENSRRATAKARAAAAQAEEDERKLKDTLDTLAKRDSQLAQHADELEHTVQQRTAELERSLQSVEGLCYTIAHDLRAPLRAMQGFARALADDCKDQMSPTAATYTQRITRAATRMDALITDLLAYGRLGMTDMTAMPTELDSAVDAFLTDYAEEVKARHATICVERLMPIVMANRTLLGQVIANLLLNAMKFVAPGATPQIRVYAESQGSRVRLNIEDNGIGIAEEHRVKLFQVFQRLHGPEQYAGSGIGLAIVKKAVERMGGTVGFSSTPGKGSTFWIELPGGNAKENLKTQNPNLKKIPMSNSK